ncbi:MAG: 3-dehydroquinate synthase [Pirellulales bacterium]
MSAAAEVRVRLAGREYSIEIGTGNVARAGRLVTAGRKATQAIVVTDEHVHEPHAAAVAQSLAEEGLTVDILAIEAGESSKSVEMADRLWQKFLDLGADRQTIVVAVGGGVVGDLAGFVAATYARGLPLVQVPTTLLAQVDSSIGGKVAVNLPGAKNLVGAFWQPLAVLVDTEVLSTLPDREYRSGLAEVVKYGVVLDAELFAYLEAHVEPLLGRRHDVLRHVVRRCCQLKADVVAADERDESGLRAVLNYGHTFGHAFESLTGYSALLHGEAVAAGMLCASRLAERLGRVDQTFTGRQRDLLTALGLSVAPPGVDHEQVLLIMTRDKKAEHGRLRFVLPSRMGQAELVDDVSADDVRGALAE